MLFVEQIILLKKFVNKIVRKILVEKSYLTGKYCLLPEFLNLIITFKCNFKCQACSIWKKNNFNELLEEQWLKISADLKKTFKKETYIEINGGEPLLRKDLALRLIKNLKEYFLQVALNSNGSLIDEKTVQELEEAGLDLIKISFYSLNKEINNSLRGDERAYDQALQAIKLLSQSKIKVEVGVLVTAKNIKELPILIKYLDALNNVKVSLQSLDESVEAEGSKNKTRSSLLTDLWPEESDVKKFFGWVLENQTNIKNSLDNIKVIEKYYLNPKNVLKYRCFAGQRNCVIYPDGAVTFCFRGETIGRLPEKEISEILSAREAIQERIDIKHCQKYCRTIGCNFSRGLKEFVKDKFSK